MGSILYSAMTIAVTLAILSFGIALLPDANGLPTGITTAITQITTYMKAYSFLLDFNTLFVVFGIILSTEVVILAGRVVFWFIGIILRARSN